jgi:hypothetical protein
MEGVDAFGVTAPPPQEESKRANDNTTIPPKPFQRSRAFKIPPKYSTQKMASFSQKKNKDVDFDSTFLHTLGTQANTTSLDSNHTRHSR